MENIKIAKDTTDTVNKKQSFLYLIKSPFLNIERIMDDDGDLA